MTLNDRHGAIISLADTPGELAVKDNICVQGFMCTASSKLLENYEPPYTATAVQKLQKQGLTVMGKTSCDEFACGSTGTHTSLANPRNPLDEKRVPGGSSSGSAIAVKDGLVRYAIGSDTGGSVRCPATFCQIVGYRPSYGQISRYGLMDMCMSFDTIGTLTRNVDDAIYLITGMSGKDDKDLTTMNSVDVKETPGLAGKRLVAFRQILESCDPGIREKFNEATEKAKLHVDVIDFPEIHKSIPTYYMIVFAEFASAMQRFDGKFFGKNRELLGQDVKRRILLGTFISQKENKDKWYTQAINARKWFQQKFEAMFAKYDFVINPTMPSPAPLVGEITDPITEYSMDLGTIFPSLMMGPSISLPYQGMGIQLTGKRFSDSALLYSARDLEGAL